VKPADRELAESAIRRLLIGARIGGLRFGPVPQILFADAGGEAVSVRGQVYMNLGSAWTVFPTRPASFPVGESQIQEGEPEQEIQEIVGIRERQIIAADLATDAPDLILTLDDGRVVFFNGRSEHYETWELGTAYTSPADRWLVVAIPGNEIAVWVPERYSSEQPAV
jgi:hypothetical protein